MYSIYITTKNYLQQYISQKVKYFRTQNKMSQEELSEQAGLGLKYINQLENQNVNLTIHSLEKVIDALEMTQRNFSILIALNQPLIRVTIFHSKEST